MQYGRQLRTSSSLQDGIEQSRGSLCCGSVQGVGHVPRRISSICSSFLRRGGMITCRVTGARRYSPRSDTAFLEVRKMICKVAQGGYNPLIFSCIPYNGKFLFIRELHVRTPFLSNSDDRFHFFIQFAAVIEEAGTIVGSGLLG